MTGTGLIGLSLTGVAHGLSAFVLIRHFVITLYHGGLPWIT
jgi:hypothetical protein